MRGRLPLGLLFPAILLAVFPSASHAADRIEFENGLSIECAILSQTGDAVLYEKDGVQKAVEKTEIKRIELDVGIDKYLRAARLTTDTAKRVLYFERSIQAYGENPVTRQGLFYAYLADGQLAKAEAQLFTAGPNDAVARALIIMKAGRPRTALHHLRGLEAFHLSPSERRHEKAARAFSLGMLGDLDGALAAMRDLTNQDGGALAPLPFTAEATTGQLLRALEGLKRPGGAAGSNDSAALFRMLSGSREPSPAFVAAVREERQSLVDSPVARAAVAAKKRPFAFAVELGSGSLASFSVGWTPARRFALGLVAGFDVGKSTTLEQNLDQVLWNAGVWGAWNALKLGAFNFDLRLSVGYLDLSLPLSGTREGAWEITPAMVLVTPLRFYVTVSLLCLLPTFGPPIDPVPQFGMGYRFPF